MSKSLDNAVPIWYHIISEGEVPQERKRSKEMKKVQYSFNGKEYTAFYNGKKYGAANTQYFSWKDSRNSEHQGYCSDKEYAQAKVAGYRDEARAAAFALGIESECRYEHVEQPKEIANVR